ncbi:membrane-bound lytic murein transglycosylase MltF [Ectothiorhodospiraceae bacterium WFHF3C12]|nr:membrane-bound lytic murein transglycosylase MltF [Ectothiorhodospiraceae bacterium WFHF3C12]
MRRSQVRFSFLVIVLLLMLVAWSGFLRKPSQLETVRDRGEVTIVTRVSDDTYLRNGGTGQGMEYDLASRFSEQLGVSLEIKVAETVDEALAMLLDGQADIAAAGVGVTAEREGRYRLTDPYMRVNPQLVYRSGGEAPDSLESLAENGGSVGINPSQLGYLHQSDGVELPELNWRKHDDTTDDLLYQVWNGDIPYAIVDSNEVLLARHFYPELRVAFDVGGSKPLAWALSPETDGSLHREVQAFFAEIEKDGSLARLQERYYGHLGKFDYVGTRLFMRHVANRLPQYRGVFQEAARENGLDWRLLAAIGYQESHWNPKAVSPTGVRGVMMLTQDTAAHVGIDNRVDAGQSIRGGAIYFSQVRDRIPDRIPEPRRTWFALAAYNVGLGHLEDARIITETQDANPDSWLEVKKRLPLLSQKKYYQHTQHGKARGWEPVRYVENVRRYYELLKRITEPEVMSVGLYPDESATSGPRVRQPLGVRLGDSVESAF